MWAIASDALAWVDITSPSNDATVSGIIQVKATITTDYWSQLVIDSTPIASGAIGTLSFTWDTTSLSDGPHKVTVKGYAKASVTPDSFESISVSVANKAATSRHFGTLPASAALPNGSWCASVIPFETEMVLNNYTANHTKPTTSQLNSYASNGYASNTWDGTWAYARVDGQYTGTTDMIIRWAACKWGIDEDVARAQTTVEHWSWDETTAHGDKRTSYSQCVNGNFTDLWNYQCINCCYQTWSDWQTKVYYNWMTWPMMGNSSAFGADFRYADQRACMNGDLRGYFAARPTYNGHNYADDIASGNLDTVLWGCIGAHYSGNWYDGDSTTGAVQYINIVKDTLSQKTWKRHWPAVNWPD